jgi:CheY-like chemotaxis protein
VTPEPPTDREPARAPGRPIALVIHHDGEVLDRLTTTFEAGGFDVVTALTGFRAQALLEGERNIEVVIAPWDARHPVGGEVYRWALQRRYDLRGQFVFLADEVATDFDRVVAGRCLAVTASRPAEIVRIAEAAVARRASHAPRGKVSETMVAVDGELPTLLLAEDEPVLLMVMSRLFGQAGYAVTSVESGNAAIDLLAHEDVDVIVADWHMDAGSGRELYRWLLAHKPGLAERIVFLSGGGVAEVEQSAPGRPVFPKGQDSEALLRVLEEIVLQAKSDEPWT